MMKKSEKVQFDLILKEILFQSTLLRIKLAFMMGNGSRESQMVKERLLWVMELFLRVNLRMVKQMEMTES